jgi:hypothetical protein
MSAGLCFVDVSHFLVVTLVWLPLAPLTWAALAAQDRWLRREVHRYRCTLAFLVPDPTGAKRAALILMADGTMRPRAPRVVERRADRRGAA